MIWKVFFTLNQTDTTIFFLYILLNHAAQLKELLLAFLGHIRFARNSYFTDFNSFFFSLCMETSIFLRIFIRDIKLQSSCKFWCNSYIRLITGKDVKKPI